MTDFRKTVETGVDPRLLVITSRIRFRYLQLVNPLHFFDVAGLLT